MKPLKIICILLCGLSLVSALMGITKSNGLGSFYSFGWPLFFAAAFYGIHKRVLITWKLGWVFLAVWALDMLIRGLSVSLKLPQPDRWIVSAGILIGCLLFALYWGFWWKRQRNYFERNETK